MKLWLFFNTLKKVLLNNSSISYQIPYKYPFRLALIRSVQIIFHLSLTTLCSVEHGGKNNISHHRPFIRLLNFIGQLRVWSDSQKPKLCLRFSLLPCFCKWLSIIIRPTITFDRRSLTVTAGKMQELNPAYRQEIRKNFQV